MYSKPFGTILVLVFAFSMFAFADSDCENYILGHGVEGQAFRYRTKSHSELPSNDAPSADYLFLTNFSHQNLSQAIPLLKGRTDLTGQLRHLSSRMNILVTHDQKYFAGGFSPAEEPFNRRIAARFRQSSVRPSFILNVYHPIDVRIVVHELKHAKDYFGGSNDRIRKFLEAVTAKNTKKHRRMVEPCLRFILELRAYDEAYAGVRNYPPVGSMELWESAIAELKHLDRQCLWEAYQISGNLGDDLKNIVFRWTPDRKAPLIFETLGYF